MKKTILIRCDASKEIGLGHITRCLVLANKFRILGYEIIFAMKEELGIEKAKKEEFRVENWNSKLTYEKWIINLLSKYNVTLFIGDIRDGFPIELIEIMKNNSILTIAIDEPSEYAFLCDLVFYPPHSKIDRSLYKGKVYQGLEYVILREDFYLANKKINNIIPRVLVMLGGTDSQNKSFDVVQKILGSKLDIKLDIVLSNDNKDFNKIKKLSTNITMHSNIVNMANFLKKIDLAIITFGMAAYELIQMNIPSIHICINEDHLQSSQYFLDNKYILRNGREFDTLKEKDLCLIDSIKNMTVNSNDCIINIIEKEYFGFKKKICRKSF